MTTNIELEEQWIEAWNDLLDSVGQRWQVSCLLPDGSVVDVETCKGWLQESAYQDYCLKVEEGWVNGNRDVVVFRFKEGESL